MAPSVQRHQLHSLGVTQGRLDDLLDGHRELVEHYLETGLRLGPAAGDGTGTRVLGVGIAEHVIDGRPSGEPALLMLVDKLDDPESGLPRFSGRGVPIVVEEVGEIIPAAGFRAKYRPVQGGVSIAPCARAYSGTLGCVVRSGNTRYILSNNHVLADVSTLPLGSTISQQSTQDGGTCPADVIASLSQFVPININGNTSVDAAIAAISANVNVDPRILRDNGAVERLVAPVTAPVLDLAVQKSGRTTGYTRAARVKAIAITITINFAAGSTTLLNVFSVKRTSGYFALGGDSGSLITTDPGNQPVGLLVSIDGNRTTYASPMSDVLTALSAVTGSPVTVVY